MTSFPLKIVTPDGLVFDGEVEEVALSEFAVVEQTQLVAHQLIAAGGTEQGIAPPAPP